MRVLRAALAAGVVVCLVAAADAAPARKKAGVQAAPQGFEALYLKCRTEAFRRFGWHYGTRLVLYSDFAVTQVDFCVRNGGHY